MRKNLENLILTAIVSVCGMGVNYIAALSDNVRQMNISLQIIGEKLTSINSIIQDHEARIRKVEKLRK